MAHSRAFTSSWYGLTGFILAGALLMSACAPQRAAEPAKPAEPSKPPASDQSAPAAKGQAGAGPASMVLKFTHVVAKDTPKHKAAERFSEIVQQRSNGRIEVQVFANSELYKDAEEVEALQTGAVQFIAPGTDKFGTLVPMWEATALPYLFTSNEAVDKLIAPGNATAKTLFESLRPKGILGLAIWPNGFKHFSDSKKPLIAPADFQGLKFRTSGKPDEAFVKALGGSAQVMAFSEVFGALQQGVVDGQYNTWSNIYTQKFHEVQKYATASRGGAFLTYGVATNAAWWDGLDDATRKLLGDAMDEASRFEKESSDKDNDDALAGIRQSDRMEIHEQSAEEVKAFLPAAEQIQKEWEPRTGKDIIDQLKAMNN